MTSLGWIHFSQAFKDRVSTILDMMDEEGMVDEIGVGVFRDAFAEIFFPGISTIQTRAKYFFIVSYLIQDYFNLSQAQRKGLGNFLYEQEHNIMWELATMYNFDRNSGSGVIGITKRKPNRIVRRPSSIYWNGLRQFRFIDTTLSISEYMMKADETLEQKLSRNIASKFDDSDDSDIDCSEGHQVKVPTYNKDWKTDLDLQLSFDEADFFKNQIKKMVSTSIIGQLFAHKDLLSVFQRNKDFSNFARSINDIHFDSELKYNILLAHDFNEVVKGLHWIYCNEINLKHYGFDGFHENFNDWKNQLYGNLIQIDELDHEKINAITPNAKWKSKEFIKNVIEIVKSGNIDYQTLAELVIVQEKEVKKHKSRFRSGAEKDFRKGEKRSLSYLNYRYSNAKTIVNDIIKGWRK